MEFAEKHSSTPAVSHINAKINKNDNKELEYLTSFPDNVPRRFPNKGNSLFGTAYPLQGCKEVWGQSQLTLGEGGANPGQVTRSSQG